MDDYGDRIGYPDGYPRFGPVLRRHGARQKHAVNFDAGVRHILVNGHFVGDLRLQHRVYRRQCFLWRFEQAVS